jgi:hypothetical protein
VVQEPPGFMKVWLQKMPTHVLTSRSSHLIMSADRYIGTRAELAKGCGNPWFFDQFRMVDLLTPKNLASPIRLIYGLSFSRIIHLVISVKKTSEKKGTRFLGFGCVLTQLRDVAALFAVSR